MTFNIHFVSCILCFSLLMGCIPHKNSTISKVSAKNIAKVTSTALYIFVQDNQFNAEIDRSMLAFNSGAYRFGFIGGVLAGVVDASIEAVRRKQAEDFVAPLRHTLNEYDLAQHIYQALAPKLQTLKYLHINHVDILTTYDKQDLMPLMKKHYHDAIIIIDAKINLTPNFRALHISANAKLYLYGYNGGRQLFSTNVHSISEIIPREKHHNIAMYWSNRHGKHLKEHIDLGIQHISRRIHVKFKKLNPNYYNYLAYQTITKICFAKSIVRQHPPQYKSYITNMP